MRTTRLRIIGALTLVLALGTTVAVASSMADASSQKHAATPLLTKSFVGAKPAQVFAWLRSQGLSFVAETSQIPAGKTVTLNIVRKPAGDVIEALADALGMVAVNHKGVYALKPQASSRFFSGLGQPNAGPDTDWSSKLPELFKQFEFDVPNGGGDGTFIVPFEGTPKTKSRVFAGNRDLNKLYDSLTPAQRAKHDKQGYLTPDDLTADQRKLLGMPTDGRFELRFEAKGKRLTIKNKNR